MLNKTDNYLRMNVQNNILIISQFLIEIKKKYKNNKKLNVLQKAIFEICCHVNNQDILYSCIVNDLSQIRQERNKAIKELYEYKPIIKIDTNEQKQD